MFFKLRMNVIFIIRVFSRFQFRDFKTHRLNSQSHLDSSTEDETSVVPAETLFELLRRIFRLCQKTFCRYEIYMRNLHSKRDPQPSRVRIYSFLILQLSSNDQYARL